MCTGDLTPVPFEKVVREGRTAYKAVFERVEHKCNGEFAEYYGWSMERKVSTKAEGFELNIL